MLEIVVRPVVCVRVWYRKPCVIIKLYIRDCKCFELFVIEVVSQIFPAREVAAGHRIWIIWTFVAQLGSYRIQYRTLSSVCVSNSVNWNVIMQSNVQLDFKFGFSEVVTQCWHILCWNILYQVRIYGGWVDWSGRRMFRLTSALRRSQILWSCYCSMLWIVTHVVDYLVLIRRWWG